MIGLTEPLCLRYRNVYYNGEKYNRYGNVHHSVKATKLAGSASAIGIETVCLSPRGRPVVVWFEPRESKRAL